MPKIMDRTGERHGRLLVVAEAGKIGGRKTYLCACDCGNEKVIQSSYLQSGKVQSCGCLRAEMSAARGRARFSAESKRNQALYRRWATMKQRCENRKNPFFKNYGARGITVCEAWRDSYDAFLADMGQPPSAKHTLERIDNDAPYSPENCRWALPSEQLRNQRRTILITVGDETLSAKDWAAKTGVSYQRITRAFRQHGIEAATELVNGAL